MEGAVGRVLLSTTTSYNTWEIKLFWQVLKTVVSHLTHSLFKLLLANILCRLLTHFPQLLADSMLPYTHFLNYWFFTWGAKLWLYSATLQCLCFERSNLIRDTSFEEWQRNSYLFFGPDNWKLRIERLMVFILFHFILAWSSNCVICPK